MNISVGQAKSELLAKRQPSREFATPGANRFARGIPVFGRCLSGQRRGFALSTALGPPGTGRARFDLHQCAASPLPQYASDNSFEEFEKAAVQP